MDKDTVYMHLEIKQPYSWLWIKYVTGFRSNTHCMNCLVGGRSEIIPPRRKQETQHPYWYGTKYSGPLNEYKYSYIYLCGVTDNYADNLHVVVRYKKGSIVQHEDKFCKVTLTNCERVPIPAISEKIDRGYQHTTCRNFQMGYAYLRHTDPYDGMSAIDAGITKKVAGSRTMQRVKSYTPKAVAKPNFTRIRYLRKQ